MTNILTNPVVIALAVGVLTYMYLVWTTPKTVKRTKRGKKKTIKKSPGFLMPIAMSVVTWVLVYCYQEYYCKSTSPSVASDSKYSLKKGSESGSEAKRSYRMMRPGIGMVRSGIDDANLPDVFINTID